MAKTIILKPVLSEKSEVMTNGLNKYTFVVNKSANKIEIRKAIESTYSVNVEKVNTGLMPGKRKVKMTKSGYVRGRVPSFKKAVVTLSDGEMIDFYGEP